MARRYWWPTAMPDQVALLTNFRTKIPTHSAALGWTPAQETAVEGLCSQLIMAFSYADACRASMQYVTQWRDLVFTGGPEGSAAPPPPVFPTPPDAEFTRGCVTRFTHIRDQIVLNDNYTQGMGEDLGIVGAEITPPPADSVVPNLKVTVSGDMVNVSGSMQGLPALKLMYTPKGGTPREVAFITSTPAGFTITKMNPAEPENGELQAVYFKKNLPYGNPSPLYPVTLA